MKRDTHHTIVIFRVFKGPFGGDALALFPYEQGTNEPGTCDSYQHVGQHGTADYHYCMAASRAATPKEYAPLKRELESLGYKLLIRKKRSVR